jgi:hypothetical protein
MGVAVGRACTCSCLSEARAAPLRFRGTVMAHSCAQSTYIYIVVSHNAWPIHDETGTHEQCVNGT